MHKLRVAIIEDEPLAADRLRKLLGDYPDCEIEVVGEAESIAEAIELLPTWTLDLLLCDIRLGDGLSFNIWDHVAVDCPTIFTTAYEEYALRAFKVNSIDYLLKPIEPSELYATLTRFVESESSRKQSRSVGTNSDATATGVSGSTSDAQAGLTPEVIAQVVAAMREPRYQQRFMSKVGDRLVPLATTDIAYFKSIDRITWAYRFDGSRLPVGETLDQVEQRVDPSVFARLNRAVIAQAASIEQLTAYSNSRYRAQLKGDTSHDPVIVARDRVASLKKWLAGGLG